MRPGATFLLAGLAAAGVASLAAWIVESSGDAQPSRHDVVEELPRPQRTSRAASRRADASWGAITGRVADIDGKAVSGATVVAQDLRGFGGLATTRDDGTYRLDLMLCAQVRPYWPGRGWNAAGVPAHEVEVFVAARSEGFSRSLVRSVRVRRATTEELRPLVLYRGGRIEGRVVDADGSPVAARVRVVSVDYAGRREGLQGLDPGHGDGFVASHPGEGFVIEQVGPGTVELLATAPGAGGARGVVEVAEAQTTRLDVVIDLPVRISGRVVDTAGRGAAGVRVTCRLPAAKKTEPTPKVRGMKPRGGLPPRSPELTERDLSARGTLATDTDADGHFAFFGVRDDGLYAVAVSSAPASTVRDVAPGTTDLLFEIPARVTLIGSVRDAVTGEPIGGCGVKVLDARSSSFVRLRFPLGLRRAGKSGPATDEAGAFRSLGQFPGTYRVIVTRHGYEVAETSVSLSEAAANALDVALVPAAALRLVVLDAEGRPVPSAEARLSPRESPGRRPGADRGRWTGRLFATSAASGEITFAGLPAGEDLLLRVRDQDGRSVRRDIRMEPSEVRDETLRLLAPASVLVRVRPHTHGARVGHPVRLTGIDDPEIDVFVRTDELGLAEVSHLPPGRYLLRATDPLENPGREEVQARETEIELLPGAARICEFEIADVNVVEGSVVHEGVPVEGGRIGFGPMAGTADHFRPLLFDVRGGLFSGRVPPGRYHVHVVFPGTRIEIDEPVDVPAGESLTLHWDLPVR